MINTNFEITIDNLALRVDPEYKGSLNDEPRDVFSIYRSGSAPKFIKQVYVQPDMSQTEVEAWLTANLLRDSEVAYRYNRP